MIHFAFEMGKIDLVKIPILINLICKINAVNSKDEHDFLEVILKFILKSKHVYLARKKSKLKNNQDVCPNHVLKIL